MGQALFQPSWLVSSQEPTGDDDARLWLSVDLALIWSHGIPEGIGVTQLTLSLPGADGESKVLIYAHVDQPAGSTISARHRGATGLH